MNILSSPADTRNLLRLIFIALIGIAPLWAQESPRGVSNVFLTGAPTWMYNGFTADSDGESVQGSDVSPLRMSFGFGVEYQLSESISIEPEGWVFMQEYISLHAYPKTVPTQIETGSAVGDIASTIGLGVSLPFTYTWQWPFAEGWTVDARMGPGFVFRIPVQGVDGTNPGEVGRYWIAGRFIYPQIGAAVDYRFGDTVRVGAIVDWFIPLYNAWDSDVPTPFLDETMVRGGIRVRWTTERR